MEHQPGMRMFCLIRKEDVSGVSGTGRVAEGIQFSDGTAAIRWVGRTASMVFWQSVDDAMEVHGHGGATELVWL
jgi:hypothetical protein